MLSIPSGLDRRAGRRGRLLSCAPQPIRRASASRPRRVAILAEMTGPGSPCAWPPPGLLVGVAIAAAWAVEDAIDPAPWLDGGRGRLLPLLPRQGTSPAAGTGNHAPLPLPARHLWPALAEEAEDQPDLRRVPPRAAGARAGRPRSSPDLRQSPSGFGCHAGVQHRRVGRRRPRRAASGGSADPARSTSPKGRESSCAAARKRHADRRIMMRHDASPRPWCGQRLRPDAATPLPEAGLKGAQAAHMRPPTPANSAARDRPPTSRDAPQRHRRHDRPDVAQHQPPWPRRPRFRRSPPGPRRPARPMEVPTQSNGRPRAA